MLLAASATDGAAEVEVRCCSGISVSGLMMSWISNVLNVDSDRSAVVVISYSQNIL